MNDAWVEAVARAICEGMGMDPNADDGVSGFGPQWKQHTELARAAIATLVPLVAERCARDATSFLVGDPANGVPLRNPMAHEVAERIRALTPNLTGEA